MNTTCPPSAGATLNSATDRPAGDLPPLQPGPPRLLCCRFHSARCVQRLPGTQAERVVDKDRSNFCDFFSFRDPSGQADPQAGKTSSRDRLESLFRK